MIRVLEIAGCLLIAAFLWRIASLSHVGLLYALAVVYVAVGVCKAVKVVREA